MGIHSLTAFSSSQPLGNQGLQEPEIEIQGKGCAPALEREAPSYPEDASGAVVHAPAASKRERDESYGTIITRLDAKSRVIDCKDGIQWIVQRLRGDQWHGLSFCRTRAVLIRDAKRRLGKDIPGEALDVLKALPKWHP